MHKIYRDDGNVMTVASAIIVLSALADALERGEEYVAHDLLRNCLGAIELAFDTGGAGESAIRDALGRLVAADTAFDDSTFPVDGGWRFDQDDLRVRNEALAAARRLLGE